MTSFYKKEIKIMKFTEPVLVAEESGYQELQKTVYIIFIYLIGINSVKLNIKIDNDKIRIK